MGRHVVLSNGQLFVGLNEHGLVHDFYYPYIGLENLTNARSIPHKIGVWVDGSFSWTDDGSWETHINYIDRAMVSDISLQNATLGVTVTLNDFVQQQQTIFLRSVTVENFGEAREIRVFMHQVFEISRHGRADTAMYVPDEHYVLDYKGRYCLAIGGKWSDNSPFDQYAVGNYGIENKAGTYRDAEDGELSGNPVEHGGVDSVIRFSAHFEAEQRIQLYYWIAVAASQIEADKLHVGLKHGDIHELMHDTVSSWRDWVGKNDLGLPESEYRSLSHSLLVVKAHCDSRGSVLASGDSSIFNYGRDYYCYCWPRDAAYALWPLIRLGHFDEARRFFEFARDTMHKDGYLMHKYQPDRAIGSTWHPLVHGRRKELAIQEDETASVLFIIGEYYEATGDKVLLEGLYHSLVVPCANFMSHFIDAATGLPHASYDLWEEKFLTSSYTTATVIGGLLAAAKLALAVDDHDAAARWRHAAEDIRGNLDKLIHPEGGYFVKGILLGEDGEITIDETVDISSLYGPFMYAGLPMDDQRLVATARAVEERIANTTAIGGVLRYEDDYYFKTREDSKGNPWIVASLWLAQYYATAGRAEEAWNLLRWAKARELPSGVLSEQYDPDTGEPLSVVPLVWSQAEMINSVLDIVRSEKQND